MPTKKNVELPDIGDFEANDFYLPTKVGHSE